MSAFDKPVSQGVAAGAWRARGAAVGVFAALLGGALAGCGPHWDFDFDSGVQRARAGSVPLMLYFTDLMSNVHYDIQRQVMSDPIVQKALTGYANVALSYHWGPPPQLYGVTQPYVAIACRPDGTEVARMGLTPIPQPAQFAAWLNASREMALGAASSAGSKPAASGP